MEKSSVYCAFKDGKKYAIKEVLYIHEKDKKVADSEGKYLNLLKNACAYLVNLVELFDEVLLLFLFFILKGWAYVFRNGIL
jgi:hypothetical protein